MACADVDMDIRGTDENIGADENISEAEQREMEMIRYKAAVLLPDDGCPLFDLLQKQHVLGSLQLVSGVFSVAVGILFALNQEMKQSYFTLFRVSHMTGALFIVAGAMSNLLLKCSQLLSVSLMVNCGCIAAASVAACLIIVDLADWNQEHDNYLRIEVMELCVLGLQASLSVIICLWLSKEKRARSP